MPAAQRARTKKSRTTPPSNIKETALAKGFYVLEQSGDTMKMDLPKGFKPKEW